MCKLASKMGVLEGIWCNLQKFTFYLARHKYTLSLIYQKYFKNIFFGNFWIYLETFGLVRIF